MIGLRMRMTLAQYSGIEPGFGYIQLGWCQFCTTKAWLLLHARIIIHKIYYEVSVIIIVFYYKIYSLLFIFQIFYITKKHWWSTDNATSVVFEMCVWKPVAYNVIYIIIYCSILLFVTKFNLAFIFKATQSGQNHHFILAPWYGHNISTLNFRHPCPK